MLGLVSAVAEDQPLLCLVDYFQWLDDASAPALEFVARRLLAEPLALVFAVREPSTERHLPGFPELPVRGLDDVDSRALLETVTRTLPRVPLETLADTAAALVVEATCP